MSIFGKKITEEKKEEKKPVKQVRVSAAKKEEKKPSMKELYSAGAAEKAPSGKQESEKEGGKAVRKYGNAYKILVKPLVTEKSSIMNAENKYIFAVALPANKIEVAKAIKEVYGIKPASVNIIRMEGKKARYGKTSGKRKDWKKAIITLPKGESIKVYEGV